MSALFAGFHARPVYNYRQQHLSPAKKLPNQELRDFSQWINNKDKDKFEASSDSVQTQPDLATGLLQHVAVYLLLCLAESSYNSTDDRFIRVTINWHWQNWKEEINIFFPKSDTECLSDHFTVALW